MEQIFELTVLVPVYNEAANLPRVERELTAFLKAAPVKTKVLFINDGSSDQSPFIIESICASNPSFSFIHLEGNHGLSTALKAGFDSVDTSLTGYIDADLQTSPQDFLKLLTYCKEYDLVNGIRTHRKDNAVKRLSSKIANAIRRSVTHDGSADTGCPLKIIHTDLLKKLPFFKGMHRFIPALVVMAGGTVKEIPVNHYPRLAGKSNYHLWNRLIGPFMDLIAFSWMQHHYIRYQILKKG